MADAQRTSTVTTPAACGGATTLSSPFETRVIDAGASPNITLQAAEKPSPMRVTLPPATGADAGATSSTIGAKTVTGTFRVVMFGAEIPSVVAPGAMPTMSIDAIPFGGIITVAGAFACEPIASDACTAFVSGCDNDNKIIADCPAKTFIISGEATKAVVSSSTMVMVIRVRSSVMPFAFDRST